MAFKLQLNLLENITFTKTSTHRLGFPLLLRRRGRPEEEEPIYGGVGSKGGGGGCFSCG
jgi:hypothetical protein